MAVVRWVLTDPVTLAAYELEINPSEVGDPKYEKNVSFEATAAASGGTLMYEGRQTPQRLTWKGAIFTEAEHLAFITWWEKGYQVDVTDDLGDQFRIYILNYLPERKRAVHYPYRRNYSIEAIIIDT